MSFVHEALYYATVDEFLTGTLDFVRAGVAAGEPTLVAVPEPRLGLLQNAFLQVRVGATVGGSEGATQQVWFADMAEAGRNPGGILPWVLKAFAGRHEGRVRIIGEPIFLGRRPEELGPCVQHEALTNLAFQGEDLTILCPYHTSELPEVVPYAERTHPIIVRSGRRRPSRDYTEPAKVVAMVNRPLPEPTRVDERMVFDLQGLAGVRRLVAVHAATAGLDAERIADLQLAVTEVCTNAVIHEGDGLGSLRLWTDEGRVVCEVRSAGQIVDIMAGRVVPAHDSPHGRGLAMVNRICDLVQTYTAPSGTMTRLFMRVSAN